MIFFLSCAGTIFLCSQPEVMNALIRTLVPPNLEEVAQMEEDDMLPLVVRLSVSVCLSVHISVLFLTPGFAGEWRWRER